MTFGFPTIPHLRGSKISAGDVVLTLEQGAPFLEEPVLVFEKLDGINVTLRRHLGKSEFELKKKWRGAHRGRVERALQIWMRQREAKLAEALRGGVVIVAEWCWHRLHTRYHQLPAPLLGFGASDVRGRPLPWAEASALMRCAGVVPNTPLYTGQLLTMTAVKELAGRSRYGAEQMEGVIIQRTVDADELWAKWVHRRYRQVGPAQLTGEKNGLKKNGLLEEVHRRYSTAN